MYVSKSTTRRIESGKTNPRSGGVVPEEQGSVNNIVTDCILFIAYSSRGTTPNVVTTLTDKQLINITQGPTRSGNHQRRSEGELGQID
jgi:hypothetical protein